MSAAEAMGELDPRILLAFDLRPRRIEPMRGAFRVEDSRGTWVLKRFPHCAEDLQFIYKVQQHLLASGYRRFSPICLTPQGALSLEFEQYHWILTAWMEGRECDYDRWKDLGATAGAVAELHRLSRGFFAPEYGNRSLWGRWPDIFNNKIKQLEECRLASRRKAEQGDFDRLFLNHLEGVLEEAKEASRILEFSPYHSLMKQEALAGGFCHHDLAHHNVIINEMGDPYFIDFDHSIQDTRLHDLASLIIRVLKRDHWSIEKAYKILEAYSIAYPLSDDHVKVMYCLLAFPNDFWQYAFSYYFENLRQPAEYHTKRLKRFCSQQKYRRRFLREFGDSL
ncbi:CotS family spore coat protein [Heliobacillus mobilis]|uniref:CotS family spore coat protein n=1 Tax=Heliobacterium mobile TaxID=28064 RepID=A0A6I3SKH5_HELMO|nr:CotS family spore coat protein [Heliobacterium mobile]MTV49286.1 CotS family spore coat protein [Heliobacterium mobile]